MKLSDKLKSAKHSSSLFDDISPERMRALKIRGRIASAIAQARRNLGMTQSEFAQYCDVSQPMVSKWESGEYNFSLDGWAALSHRLSIPFDPMQFPVCPHATIGTYNIVSSQPANYRAAASDNVIEFEKYRAIHCDALKEE